MSDKIHDEEERDLIDMASADLRTMPLYRTAPERIGLAIGDELEDWNSEFHDCEEVTWYSGEPPVQVCIGYVRADHYDALRAQLSEAQARLADAESRIEQSQKQEPVAWIETGQLAGGIFKKKSSCIGPCKPLYADPVSPAAQVADTYCPNCYCSTCNAEGKSAESKVSPDVADVRTVLGFIFGRFFRPEDARELPDDVVAAVRRVEKAVGPDTIVQRAKRHENYVAQAVADDVVRMFDAAVNEELPRVSHVEYDSHKICKHFAGEVRKRLLAAKAKVAGWIDPNDKTQQRFLPDIWEHVLFCHGGRTFYGKHTGDSFMSLVAPNIGQTYRTWECRWMYPPAALLAAAQQQKEKRHENT